MSWTCCCGRFRPVIGLPDNNRKPPAGTGGISEDDQLAAGQSESIELRSAGGAVPLAEAATVGAMLIGSADVILELVRSADFADRRCAFIVETAQRMVRENVPVDQVTLNGFVRRHGLLDSAAPRMLLASFLAEMVAVAPVPASGGWYAAQVVEAAVRRRGVVAGQRISRTAADGALADLRAVVLAELAAVMAELDRAEVSVNA